MNKRIITLLLSGILVIPLTGCSLSINGKEIFNITFNKQEDTEKNKEVEKIEEEIKEETEEVKKTEKTTDDTKKETTKTEIVNEGFYKGKDGMYHCNKCDEVPSKEEYNSGVCDSCDDDPMKDGHFESVAPYGRCPKCNMANGEDKSYQGNYCDDCFAKIKEEEYAEKHKYGDCINCGIYLTENQANSYGGRCPDCYAKYYGDTDTHMGNCDRCGDRVDLDHTNEGWGYSHLCSECTCDLQMQEGA